MFFTIKVNKSLLFIITVIIIFFIVFIYQIINQNNFIPVITSQQEYVVIIDPGHGSIDTGTHYQDIHEKNINLKIAQYLKTELQKANIKPVMTRTEDKLYQDSRIKDLRHRPTLIKKHNADLFISIHANNFPTSQPKGSQIFFKPGCEQSKLLAKKIKPELVRLREENDRSINPGNYYVLKKATVPSVLIETGFLSNPEDRNKLTNPQYQKDLAQAIKNGITIYFQSQLSGETIAVDTRKTVTIKPEMSLYYITKNNKLQRLKFTNPTNSLFDNKYADFDYQEILIKTAINELKNPPDNSLISPIPAETSLESFRIDGETAILNFSKEMKTNFRGGPGFEQLTLKAITETIVSLPGINDLKILIDNEKNTSIGGHIILD